MSLESYNKSSVHYTYSLLATTKLDSKKTKVPVNFKWINTDNNPSIKISNIKYNYLLAYPKDRSVFMTYVCDTDLTPSKKKTKSKSYNSGHDNKKINCNFLNLKPFVVRELLLSVSDDASQVLTFPGSVTRLFEFKIEGLIESAGLKVHFLPNFSADRGQSPSSITIPLPKCLSDILTSQAPGIPNFDIFSEIDKISMSNKYPNNSNRLIILCHSRTFGYEIFNNGVWSFLKMDRKDANLHMPSEKLFYNNFIQKFTYRQLFQMDVNSNIIAKITDLENLKV